MKLSLERVSPDGVTLVLRTTFRRRELVWLHVAELDDVDLLRFDRQVAPIAAFIAEPDALLRQSGVGLGLLLGPRVRHVSVFNHEPDNPAGWKSFRSFEMAFRTGLSDGQGYRMRQCIRLIL
jgi:hypothetical protein